MKKRMNIEQVQPDAYKAMLTFTGYLQKTQLTITQQQLIKIRASQINGCALCLDMHAIEARKNGETEQRIYTLSAWRETDFFTEEEQAILALTEEVTQISAGGVSDATYERAVSLLGEAVVAQVILAIAIINSWNRIAVSTHMMPAKA